ncbi:hypothetical protein EW026_g6602 [Hermanssonia centrifuga]|uniref:DUF6533 domain-containing protein n=1 Tax=Hermanssonia centrifuga TaxID=98765 RepID=A0A4S4KAJ4_9APHY|nr:hypothetical protein EW026_g6602 [Hermanssonia centrifuga]
MSGSNAEILQEFEGNLVYDYINYAMTALVAYEYLLSIDQEVALIWRRKWTGATWLFATNRYLLIANVVVAVLPGVSQTSCVGGSGVFEVIQLAQYIIFALFSALRIYALWDRNGVLFFLILAMSLTPVAINIYLFSHATEVFEDDPVFGPGCDFFYTGVSQIDYLHCKQ